MKQGMAGRVVQMGWIYGLALMAMPAQGWDPVKDLKDPGRIIKNIEREARNAGRQVDRVRREAEVQAAAPIFEQWLKESRRTSSRGARPIPDQIRRQLKGFYSDDLLNRARYKIGDPGVFNLANLSIQYGDAAAVTLIDVIVFRDGLDADYDARLWAHELKHVQQFRDWGTRDFAIRYLRSWNSVENAAYDADQRFVDSHASPRSRRGGGWNPDIPVPPSMKEEPRTRRGGGWSPDVPVPPSIKEQGRVASLCETSAGTCKMKGVVEVGASCWCPTSFGPLWGKAR